MRAARVRGLLSVLSGLRLAMPASAQPETIDAFARDATAGLNARSFYMDVEDRSRPGPTTQKQAWALGGKLWALSGWWRDMLQLGASYYLSAPLHAPADKDGTGLLAPGQDTISVLGEAFARLKLGPAKLTAGRQEIDMAYPRAAGVRANRSDVTYVGRQDNRMVPITYEAVLLDGRMDKRLNYYLGWIDKAKPRNLSEFQPVGTVFGAKGSDADMWFGGVQFSPANEVWLQGWVHGVPDVIRIGWIDADAVLRLAESRHLRIAGQVSDQRSDGAALLTGSAFSTRNAQAYAEAGLGNWTLYGALSRTGSGANLSNPLSSGPIYTQQLVRAFVRAHESAWQLGAAIDFSLWAPGVSAFVDATRGTGAIDPATGIRLADETELDIGALWVYRASGSWFDGLRSRIRWATVTDSNAAGDRRSTDLRIDFNLPFSLR